MAYFLPEIKLELNGDDIYILVRQAYHTRGNKKIAFRWRLEGSVSLEELTRDNERREVKSA
jgi:hypothetical protein